MNPQYMNQTPGPYGQGPPQGYGGPAGPMLPGPMPGQRPPGVLNGPGQLRGPPPGQFGPAKPMQNGPQGPHGDQFSEPMRGPPGQFGGGQPLPPRGPAPGQFMDNGQRPPMPNTNEMTSQMSGMNLGGPPRGPMGMPPGAQQMPRGPAPGFPTGPLPSQPPAPRPPPSGMQGPPSSMAGPPPFGMQGPPTSMHGPPPSMQGPPTSMHGPPTSMHGPPSSMHGPPSSMHGPPTSMHGPPPSMQGPPTSMHGPPPSMHGPPTSIPGMPPVNRATPTSMSGGLPPADHSGMMGGQLPGHTMPPPPGGQPVMGGAPGQMAGGFSGQGPPGHMQGQGVPPSPGPHSPPGYGNHPSMTAAYGGVQSPRPMSAMTQPQQPRKLDPDQMPSPIQVIEDDKKSRAGLFQTAQRGTVPPLVTTDFITQDQGNANPHFVRSTVYNIPTTGDILKQAQIPLSLTVSPLARLHEKEHPPPIVDFGQLGPVRCNRCKAYMSPFMVFIDGGRRFQCSLCTCITDVPPEYFNHLDHTGRRIDCYDRPELCLGSYEFIATSDYCKNNVLPKQPAYIFMIDVSYNSVKSGLVHLICQRLKNEVLVNLPKEVGAEESDIRVGFVTYNRELHFYNVKGSLAQPQMLVVSDTEDVFVPLLDGFLVKLSESEAVIDSLLEQIPQMFVDSRETELVLGPVIQAGLDALKAAECAGKLLIFHSSLPIAEAPGKLKNRDDRKLLSTDKEKTILTPQTKFYTQLGQECVAAGCGVDLFLFPNSYMDVATIGEVPRLTGGSIYKYTYFQADLDGERFMNDLVSHIQKPVAFDGIMRVRTSTGIRATDFLGNFYMSNTTDVELANVDCDKAVTVEIKHDDKLNESEGAYIQVALLYTNMSGQRRLRIHNQSFNVCTQMADMFRNCELDTLINLVAKQAIRDTLHESPKVMRENIMNRCAHILASYRKNCASPSSAGQLILPECMKLLPLYANCVMKNDAISAGSEIQIDDRSYLMHLLNSMDVSTSASYLYPRLIPLHDVDVDSNEMPVAIRCSVERLKDDGVYLLENGHYLFIWIGHSVSAEWVQSVFGVPSAAQIDIDKSLLLELDSPMSHRVRQIVAKVRSERLRHMKLQVVRQRDKLEPWFNHYLVEDKGMNGSASYVDFLCHIHKEIRNLLS